MIFGIGTKWKRFKPSQEYLDVVSKLDTISKLQAFMKNYVYKWDTIQLIFWKVLWDSWKMPDKSVIDMCGDCEDAAILAADVLGRIQKRIDVTFIMVFGYSLSNNKRKYNGHCITAFKSGTTYSIFTNNVVETGFKDILAVCRRFYPLGLKYFETRDWKGNVLSRKYQWRGTF